MTEQATGQAISSTFIDVKVKITRPQKPNEKYTVLYLNLPGNETIPVTSSNTVLRFSLVDTPREIQFVGMTSTRQIDPAIPPGFPQQLIPQLSPYSISLDRRALVCTDAHSDYGWINVNLQWIDGHFFQHDPQVGNVPVPPPGPGG